MKKTPILFSSFLNLISPLLTYIIIVRQFGDTGVNSYTLFLSAATWFSAIISIGLPKSLLLEQKTQLKSITQYLVTASLITLFTFTISAFSAVILAFAFHGKLLPFTFYTISLFWGLSFSIQDLSQSISDKYEQNSQTIKISTGCAIAPIIALLVDYYTLSSFKSFMLLLISIRIFILLGLQTKFLRDTIVAHKDAILNSGLNDILSSCVPAVRKSFSYFIGRLATTSYSFASVSIIISSFNSGLTASYFLSVRVLSPMLTIFSGFFERYALMSIAKLDKASLVYSQNANKFMKFFTVFSLSTPFLVLVFSLVLYVTSNVIFFAHPLSYRLIILVSLLFVLKLASLIVGTVNTPLLGQRYYLIVSVGYYALSYLFLLCVHFLRIEFDMYIMALGFIDLTLLAINIISLSAYLKDAKFCGSLLIPLILFVVICSGIAIV